MEVHMKSKILAAVIAAASILTTQAFASPASYQDAAWSNFIEKKAGKVTPAGFPFGKGAISRMRDGAVWPEPFIKLVAPTDMSKVKAIKLSNQAINAERTYASESMAEFLSASADKLKKLTKRKDIQLPIYMLAYRADDVPTPRLNDLLDVQIGVFLTGESPIPAPYFASDGKALLHPTQNYLSNSDYQKYASLVLSKYDTLKSMSTRQLSQEMHDIFHTVAPSHSVPPRANRDSRLEQRKAIQEKYSDQLKELRKQIREADTPDERVKLTKKLHKLQDAREHELNAHPINQRQRERASNRKAITQSYDAQIRDIELKLAALERGADSRDERKELIEALRELKSARSEALRNSVGMGEANSRHSAAQNRAHLAARQAPNNDIGFEDEDFEDDDDVSAEDSQIDLDTTWLMFEAMLTQTAETVMRIKLPGPLRTRLMSHAESAKRPAKIIEKFKDITIISQNDPVISVQIACSVRDRFLGCPVKGDEATEAKVSKIAQAIIDNAKSGSESDQLHAMQLVINASPKSVKNTMIHPESLRNAAAKALELPFANRQTNESEDTSSEIIASYKRICKSSSGERKQKGKGGKGKRNTRKPSTNRFYDEESLALPF